MLSQRLGCPIIAAVHPPKSNLHTISGTGILGNRGVAEWELTETNGLLCLHVRRLKAPGEGAKVYFKVKTDVPLEGLDDFGKPRMGKVLIPAVNTTPQQETREDWLAPLMDHLYRHPGLSVRERARALKWSPTTLTRRLDQCVERGVAVKTDGIYAVQEVVRGDFTIVNTGSGYVIKADGVDLTDTPLSYEQAQAVVDQLLAG